MRLLGRKLFYLAGVLLVGTALTLALLQGAFAARKADIFSTKHNLSSGSGNIVRALTPGSGGTDEICVFCHTPHGANTAIDAPLWNRGERGGTSYEMYDSGSLDTTMPIGPGGASKLCLSCHDGTIAVGTVTNLPGPGGYDTDLDRADRIQMQGVEADGTIPGTTDNLDRTGYTRRLGTDLRNDHPISFTYDAALSSLDAELYDPSTFVGATPQIGVPSSGVKPQHPLYTDDGSPGNKVQCTTCHDPHIGADDRTQVQWNLKFLRQNRFQTPTTIPGAGVASDRPTDGSYDVNDDILCIGCHKKEGWGNSAHAHPSVANEEYTDAAAQRREFPTDSDGTVSGTGNIRVWQAACLNCHDTHAVQGSRRLLREGVTEGLAAGSPSNDGYYYGGFTSAGYTYDEESAVEETCFQCHSGTGSVNALREPILSTLTDVPNIEADFNLTYHMPIETSEQATNTSEVHDIGNLTNWGSLDPVMFPALPSAAGGDFIESPILLGRDPAGGTANLGNRHAECTDCHNPHRVLKSACFNGYSNTACTSARDYANTNGGTHNHSAGHTNLASGVLRGTYGVEPEWGTASPSFYEVPDTFDLKRGDPGDSTLVTSSYVTREYQVCMKCHSNYAYSDTDLTTSNWRCTGGVAGRRPLLQATAGGPLTQTQPDGRTGFDCYTNQAREFAPFDSVGNTGASSPGAPNHRSWHPVMGPTGRVGRNMTNYAPWGNEGTQTMYCSDCHGADNNGANDVIPAGESANWGPHGSSNRFILKGTYSGSGASRSDLCLKCHNSGVYNGSTSSCSASGFADGRGERCDRGNLHEYHRNKIGPLNCNWCHVAIPHGWKNKGLLVNLQDVGPEAGQAVGTNLQNSYPYTRGPYYYNAMLSIPTFYPSGEWTSADCRGESWMKSNCDNPP
jgi:hypothetical protein